MKKYQYAVAIVIGILVGAVVAVEIGNTITGLLVGVLSASITSLVGSLQWSRWREGIAPVGAQLKKWCGGFVNTCDKSISWQKRAILIPWNATVATFKGILAMTIVSLIVVALAVVFVVFIIAGLPIATIGICGYIAYKLIAAPYWFVRDLCDTRVRKTCYYILVLFGLTAVIWKCLSVLWFMEVPDHLHSHIMIFILFVGMLLTLTLLLFPTAILCHFFIQWIFCCVVERGIRSRSWSHSCLKYDTTNDFVSWIADGQGDGRAPLRSVLYMLKIRSLNAVRMVVWPVLCLVWAVRYLVNSNTRACVFSTVLLSGAYLGFSYFYGGISPANINFQLSLAIALIFGVIIGRKIYGFQDGKIPQKPKYLLLLHDYQKYC